MKKSISLKPIRNKSNGQINFSLKKNSLPKTIKKKLKDLKEIKLNVDALKF